MSKRVRPSAELRRQVLERDKRVCQACGRQLWANVLVDELGETRDDIERTLRDEVAVLRWTHECWKCENSTPIVSYYLTAAYNHSIGDIESLDCMLMERYSFVKRQYSHTRERRVIANSCVHCGSLQGNKYVLDDLLGFLAGYSEARPEVDLYLPNCLSWEDLGLDGLKLPGPRLIERPLPAHVHHVDGDPGNTVLENLVLLCPECHVQVHAELRAQTSD